ncbi:MAG TPA: ABC transporter permease subunit [Pseudonocardiaceae bacterium]
MTAATMAPAPALPVNRGATHAPITRLLRSELSVVFRRPRTWIALVLLALVPVVIAIGVLVGNGPRGQGGGPIIGNLVGNGLVLPVVALTVTLAVLLPLVGAMWSADALSGESSHGTLRALLVAPVGRVRLLVVKSFGVAVAVLAASTLIAVVGMITGLALIGSNGMITLDGTTLGIGGALMRVAIAASWVAVQVWAVCAVALAVSACTDHPMVVMAATLAGAIVFGVLSTIPSLSWLQPYLLTNSWTSLTDVLRDPMPTDGLIHGLAVAGCYALIGWSLALARLITKDG